MDYPAQTSLTAMFFEQANRLGERPLLWRKADKEWLGQSWRAVAEQVNLLARGLQSLGLSKGDRVLLIAENRPEWLISDLAIMAAERVIGHSMDSADNRRLVNEFVAQSRDLQC